MTERTFIDLGAYFSRIAVLELQHAQLLMASAQAQYNMYILPVELNVLGGRYYGTADMEISTG